MTQSTLIAYSVSKDGTYVLTSPKIPQLVTEGRGLRDSVAHL